jgi:hypothetical protein
MILFGKQTKIKMTGIVVKEVECLPGKHKAPSSCLRTAKQKNK